MHLWRRGKHLSNSRDERPVGNHFVRFCCLFAPRAHVRIVLALALISVSASCVADHAKWGRGLVARVNRLEVRPLGSIPNGSTLRIPISLHGHRSNATLCGFGYLAVNARLRAACHRVSSVPVGYIRLFMCCIFCNDSGVCRNHKTSYVKVYTSMESRRQRYATYILPISFIPRMKSRRCLISAVARVASVRRLPG